jgi:hypothetical protein
MRYAAVTDQMLRAAAEAVSGNEVRCGSDESQQDGKLAPHQAAPTPLQG